MQKFFFNRPLLCPRCRDLGVKNVPTLHLLRIEIDHAWTTDPTVDFIFECPNEEEFITVERPLYINDWTEINQALIDASVKADEE